MRSWSFIPSRGAAAFALATASLAAGVLMLGAQRSSAAFPGTNTGIVFASNRAAADDSTDFEIYVAGLDGAGIVQLTNNVLTPPTGLLATGAAEGGEEAPTAIDDIQPVVSPDGKEVAFISNRPAADGSTDNEIYVMKIDGSDLRQITNVGSGPPETNAESEPAWSPDGKQIVFRRGEGCKADLWAANVVTGNEVPFPTLYDKGPAAYDAQPAWSPDGSKIAFRKGMGPYADIWVYDLASGESHPVIHASKVAETSPSWSPDGKQIAFARGDEGAGAGIWVANADGTGEHAVTQPKPDADGKVYSDQTPRWSPDGRKILFQSTRDGLLKAGESEGTGEEGGGCGGSGGSGGGGENEGGDSFDAGNVELYVINADGSGLERLTADADVNGPKDQNADWQLIPAPPAPPATPTPQELTPPVAAIRVSGAAGGRLCVLPRRLTVAIRLTARERRQIRSVSATYSGRRAKVHRHGNTLHALVDMRRERYSHVHLRLMIRLRDGSHLYGSQVVEVCKGGRSGLKTFRLQHHRHGHQS